MVRTQFVVEVQLKRQEVPSFDVYPFSLPVVRRMESVEMHPHVTFIVGENGSGKSTLLEAIAVAMGINARVGTAVAGQRFWYCQDALERTMLGACFEATSHNRGL
ncbi:MAG: AAA family ATPase [Firmicutes bacterium]|nr:AAA family ATPase [Bacillota bacterium]